ncbi:uncharacterized protein LOC117896623 [Drosophila subobscura]|uniref:uncharacterized protein LOC117896623 n=1 Tax=Drosophila subobscura TaxID=7241 RepID=UPI00155A3782|nr:uncharacterized protein LOC117896623 [Drosophila subobscura]
MLSKHKRPSKQRQRQRQLELKAASRLNQLSRMPVRCPIASCRQYAFPSGLLSHMLNSHEPSSRGGPVFRDAYESEPLRLKFPDPRRFHECDEPRCVAVLRFGGEHNNSKSTPGSRYLFVPNSELHRKLDKKYKNYLPMLLMVSRSTWQATLPDGGYGIFVVWLAAPATVKPFYYTITVFNDAYENSISVIRKTRNCAHTQRPSDFLANEADYMMLRDCQIGLLMQPPNQQRQQQQVIRMEITVHELWKGCLTKLPPIATEESHGEAIPIIYQPVDEEENETSSQTDNEGQSNSSESVAEEPPNFAAAARTTAATGRNGTTAATGPSGTQAATVQATETQAGTNAAIGTPNAAAATGPSGTQSASGVFLVF